MSTVLPDYPFDPTGLAVSNLITETQAIESRGTFDHYYVIPRVAPFFAESVKLRLYPIGANVNNPAGGTLLEEGVHFNFGYHYAYASHTIGKPIYGSINFYDRTLRGQLRMEYQTIGGEWVLDEQAYNELLLNKTFNPRIATWEQVVELPREFPVVDHDFNIDDFVGMTEVVEELDDIQKAILGANEGSLAGHVDNTNNPHNTTKDQVGLGLVDNFPTAASGEATAGVANNRFMTPLRTKQAIDALIVPLLNSHVVDFTNPHQTTKAQVGLGSVQNYAVATQAEAESGSSNARYMTPLRTREAIDAIVGNAFATHAANTANPHNTTKAQVGLGNVVNIGIATDAAALLGADDSGVITPRVLSYVLTETIGAGLADHMADSTNPHGTTKAQVGLGNVDDFPTANEAEARDATANNRFMTPLAVRQAISELVGAGSDAHIGDYSNPHRVTAAQVGAYDRDEIDLILAGKLGTEDIAADSEALFGMTQETFVDWLETQKSGNTVRFDGKTYEEAKTDILTGTAANSILFGGKTYSEVTAEIGATVEGASIQFVIPGVSLLKDEFDIEVVPPEHWVLIGTWGMNAEEQGCDVSLLMTGNRDDGGLSDETHQTILVNIGASYDVTDGAPPFAMQLKQGRVKELTPGTNPIVVGYRSVGIEGASKVELWLKASNRLHNSITVTELSFKRFRPESFIIPTHISQLITTEPAGLVYPDRMTEGTEEIQQLQAHAADTNNPHETTKAQVGLGNVDNFATASNAQAIAGTAADLFMTPASTEAKVDNEIGILADELIVVIDDALANLFN